MRYLTEQLDSLLSQLSVEITIFVSVDNSSDGTEAWFDSIEKNDSRIIVLRHEECFGGAAKNFFRLIRDVDFSSYDYVAFCDQDDVWLPDKLSHSINQLKLNNASAYSANVIAFWSDSSEKMIDKAQSQVEFDYLFEAAGPGCTYLFKVEAASLIKQYLNHYPELNEFMLHDWLSYAVLRHNKIAWFIDCVPKMRYRQHDENQVGANTSVKGMVYRFKYALSGKAFESIQLLVDTLKIPNITLTNRKGIFKLAGMARQLRRRKRDQWFAFIVLCLYAIKGPNR
ncbi:UNVERIFIED_CONTAM: hypothetical protein GTU68_010250 [Idotea baltica]|nr:hypothetical protein [Idotea baltica]